MLQLHKENEGIIFVFRASLQYTPSTKQDPFATHTIHAASVNGNPDCPIVEEPIQGRN